MSVKMAVMTFTTTRTSNFMLLLQNVIPIRIHIKTLEFRISSPVGVGVVRDDGVRNDPSVVVVKSGDVIMLLALLLVGNPEVIKSMPSKDDETSGEGVL
jgi:hypothetical protein